MSLIQRLLARLRVFNPIFDLQSLIYNPRIYNEAVIRGSTRNAFLGDNHSLCVILGRYKIFVDTQDIYISSHLMLDGFWEIWITEAMVELIKPGMVVADIGANLGYFTLLMSDLVGPAGRVHAFEPNPQMVERLNKSLVVNGFNTRAEVHEVLLGRENGEVMSFHVPELAPGGAYMLPITDGDLGSDAIVLATQRLDSREDWQRIEFMKIDVEGAEESIWAGAEQMLKQSALKIVVLEFVPSRYADPAGFLNQLAEHGFSLEFICPYRGIQTITYEDLLHQDRKNEIVMLLLRR